MPFSEGSKKLLPENGGPYFGFYFSDRDSWDFAV